MLQFRISSALTKNCMMAKKPCVTENGPSGIGLGGFLIQSKTDCDSTNPPAYTGRYLENKTNAQYTTLSAQQQFNVNMSLEYAGHQAIISPMSSSHVMYCNACCHTQCVHSMRGTPLTLRRIKCCIIYSITAATRTDYYRLILSTTSSSCLLYTLFVL